MNSLNQQFLEMQNLPEPEPAALEHSQKLSDYIRAEINNCNGAIDFEQFMQLVLYAPGLGYYSAGSRKLGAEGDFITAPELSPIFSQCLARQCEQVIRDIPDAIILEPGAGSGVMAAEVIQELQRRDALPKAYWILETSADLRERQHLLLQQRVPEYMENIVWLDEFPGKPFPGIILANEVLDALPVHKVCFNNGQINELYVAYQDGFVWQSQPANDELVEYIDTVLKLDREQLPEGYMTEVCTMLPSFVSSCCNALERGVILFVDYGYTRHEYYHEQRIDGTLLCHYRHRVHSDPLLFPGLQDITASVDFTAVAEAVCSADFHVSGFTNQVQFLMGTGLDELMQQHSQDDFETVLKTTQQVKKLTLPSEMGERFKVIGASKWFNQPLIGFRLNDQRNRL